MSSIFPDLDERAVEKLALARKAAGVTQADLAKALGRPQSFVAKYESRERRLDVAERLGAARALGADPFKMLRAAEKEAGAPSSINRMRQCDERYPRAPPAIVIATRQISGFRRHPPGAKQSCIAGVAPCSFVGRNNITCFTHVF